ncbi:isochorismatase family protein [bacterium]|nr:isochorismatase family protein [bacterium]
MGNALVVVDLQEGFVNEKTEQTAHDIKDLVEGAVFDPVVFTRFRNSEFSPHRQFLGWDRLLREDEYRLWREIEPLAKDVFDKASYTSLTPEFRHRLFTQNIDTVFVAGLDTDCCVLKTASDLFESGVRAVVLADFCASNGGEKSHKAGLLALRRLIGRNNIIEGISDLSELKDYVARNFGQNTPIIIPEVTPLDPDSLTLTDAYDRAWSLMSQAVSSSLKPTLLPTIATSRGDNPSIRVVVLREATQQEGTLSFFTDVRTEKVKEIKRNNFVALCLYDQNSNSQIIARGEAFLHHDDELAKKAFSKVPSSSLGAYMSDLPSGTPRETAHSGLPDRIVQFGGEASDRNEAYRNFCLVQVRLSDLEFATLSPDRGWMRARFEINQGTERGVWVTP